MNIIGNNVYTMSRPGLRPGFDLPVNQNTVFSKSMKFEQFGVLKR